MQREIKFRAWGTENELMIYQNNDYYAFCIRESSIDVASEDTGDWIKCEIMQYTGLKDKNGKEIYEGDVVRITHGNGYQTFEEKTEVVWGEFGFSPMNWQYHCDGCSICCEILDIEVIGNIHENPELLQEVSE